MQTSEVFQVYTQIHNSQSHLEKYEYNVRWYPPWFDFYSKSHL